MKIRYLVSGVTMAAAMIAAGAAQAQDGATWSFGVRGATDYVWRGVSQTDRNPAVFVSGQVNLSNGFYAGAGAENVDFNEGTDAEYDFWVGWAGKLSDSVTLDLGAVRYGYIGAPDGSDYDTVEIKAALSTRVGQATLTGSVYATDDFFGTEDSAVYYEVAASSPIADKWNIDGAVGRQTVSVAGGDYTTWNVGVTYAATSNVGLDLRYHDTNAHDFSDNHDSTVVASVKLSF